MKVRKHRVARAQSSWSIVRIAAGIAVASVVIVATGCGDPEEPVPAAGGGAGEAAEAFPEPVQIADGEYKSPAGYPDARERGEDAYRAEAGLPRFAGHMNGIELGDFEQLSRLTTLKCGVGGLAPGGVESKVFSFDYVPPGTAAIGPQTSYSCINGTLVSVAQEFLVYNATFAITFTPDLFLAHDAPAERISTSVVNGLDAVIIEPVTKEGFGRSWVALKTSSGLIAIEGRDLPIEETLKIARGVRCDSC